MFLLSISGLFSTCCFVSETGSLCSSTSTRPRAIGDSNTRRPGSHLAVSATRYRTVHNLSSNTKSSTLPISPSLAPIEYPFNLLATLCMVFAPFRLKFRIEILCYMMRSEKQLPKGCANQIHAYRQPFLGEPRARG